MRLVDVKSREAVGDLFLRLGFKEALGEILFSWRINSLRTMAEAAKIFEVHRTTYSLWESGQVEISVGTLKRILDRGKFERWQLGLQDAKE